MNDAGAHVRDLLAAYLDGQLSSAQGSAVASHLLQCRRCRREMDQVSLGGQLAAHLGRQSCDTAVSPAEVAKMERAVWAATRSRAAAGRRSNTATATATAPAGRAGLFAGFAIAAGVLLLASGLFARGHDPTRADTALDPDLMVALRKAAPWQGAREGVARWAAEQGRAAVSSRVEGVSVTLAVASPAAAPAAASGPWHGAVDRRIAGGFEVLSFSGQGRRFALMSRAPGLGSRACLFCHTDAQLPHLSEHARLL